MIVRVPSGYSRVAAGRADVVARDDIGAAIREAMSAGDLYTWAASHPDRRPFEGRMTAWSAPLPFGGPRVVVRRSRHGGLLAPLFRDVFLAPTRAPYELLVSALLGRAGVATPAVVAFALYRAGPLLRRSDVMSLELAGQDLGQAFLAHPDGEARRGWLAAIADLLRALTRVGAWHPDLNVTNILLGADPSGATRAFVLDVDRIRFHVPGDPTVRDANVARLVRSVRKWRRLRGSAFEDAELETLRTLASAA